MIIFKLVTSNSDQDHPASNSSNGTEGLLK